MADLKTHGLFFLATVITVPLLMLSGCRQPASHPPSPKLASKGEQLFLFHCAGCHAYNGSVTNRSIDKIRKESPTLATEDTFIQQLRNPTSMMMRPFPESDLSRTDAKEIYKFLTPKEKTDSTS